MLDLIIKFLNMPKKTADVETTEEVVETLETPETSVEETVSDSSEARAALELYLEEKGDSISDAKRSEVEAKLNALK